VAEVRAAGTIYDLGYQRYGGPRLGRNNAIANLISYSFRAAFGMGRGSKAKLLPMIVTGVVFLPAFVQVGIASASGRPELVNYAGQLSFTAFLLALFVAVQAPELVVTDKQQGVLSLYLSRPLTATDYAMSKMFALTGAMLFITLGPQLFMFFGKVLLSATPWTLFKTEYPQLAPILGGTMMTSIFVAAIGLSLSSLSAKRANATASVIATFLVLPAAAEIIRSVTTGNVRRYAPLANPILVINGFVTWLFEVQARKRAVITRLDLPGQAYLYAMIVVTILGVATLVWRYRRQTA
jgi:ABC-2 type transport system permease protein